MKRVVSYRFEVTALHFSEKELFEFWKPILYNSKRKPTITTWEDHPWEYFKWSDKMKAVPECLICTVKQVLSTTRKVTGDLNEEERILKMALQVLAGQSLDITPAELTSDFFRLTCRELNSPDPYRPEMDRYNQQALNLYPDLQRILSRSADRIFTGVLLAVAGNLIDLGIIAEIDLEKAITAVFEEGLKINHYRDLLADLSQARTLLYVLDNAGEIVFDRILMEEIKKGYPRLALKIVVKKEPAMNDALLKDALKVGLDTLGEIIDTGCGDLGIPKTRCQAEFWRHLNESDVIIAKGHANYETYEEKHPAFYAILRAKCPVVAESLGVRVHDSVLKKI